MFVNNPIAKPYMYVDLVGCNSVTQKLAMRNTLTERECTSGLVSLMTDTAVYPPTDFKHMFDHLYWLRQDVLNCPWVTVRAWSQKLFNKIERRHLRWSD